MDKTIILWGEEIKRQDILDALEIVGHPNFILIHYRYETPDGINSGELSSIVKVDGGKFYLHKLQHTLRLCGIEKTIEL